MKKLLDRIFSSMSAVVDVFVTLRSSRYALCAVLLAVLCSGPAFAADKLIVKDSGGNTKFVVTDTGQVAVGTAVTDQDVDIVAPTNGLIRLSNTATNNTTKAGRMVVRHYSNTEEPMYLFGAASTPTNNFVAFGGGSTAANAATQIDFFTALNTTTTYGTSRMTIDKNGNVGVGTSTPTNRIDVASNAIRIRSQRTPLSSADSCNQGEIAWDSDYVYVCVSANLWKRTGLSAW